MERVTRGTTFDCVIKESFYVRVTTELRLHIIKT